MANTATKPAAKADKKIVTLRGVVESDKRNQTRTVVVRFQARHAKYGKILHEQTVLQVHDEKNESKQGDVVEVQPCRRMSKTKTWRIQRVVESRSNA
jgi:small subunit ribosomal protein S17